MEKIVLIGAGGHCKVIIDIIKSMGIYEIIGVTDINKDYEKVLDIPIVGDDSILEKLYKKGVKNAFICIGALDNISFRNNIYSKLKKIGFKLPIIVHKRAVVSQYANIGEGSCVMAGAVVNAGANIKPNCIINTGAIIEHDCKLGNNCHISPNTILGGGTIIGDDCHIGIGSTVIQGINIRKNVTVGAGAVVVDDIEENIIVVGVPAKMLRKKI